MPSGWCCASGACVVWLPQLGSVDLACSPWLVHGVPVAGPPGAQKCDVGYALSELLINSSALSRSVSSSKPGVVEQPVPCHSSQTGCASQPGGLRSIVRGVTCKARRS